MLHRIALFCIVLFFSALAGAAGKPFDQATFTQAQQEGRPILVMVHADWCPTCRAQAPVIEKLAATPEFAAFTLLRVDYDKQKEAVRFFRATRQSTLIVFKGEKEVARSLGDTREAGIAALMRQAL